MDKFFERLLYMGQLVHEDYKGKQIDLALQNILSSYSGGEKIPPEIFVEDEHALNLAMHANRFNYEHRHLLPNANKAIEPIVEHLHEHPEIVNSKSIRYIMAMGFAGYDNRTIEITKDDVEPEEASRVCKARDISCIVNYRHYLFDASHSASWEKHTPVFDERMVVYAEKGQDGLGLFRDISEYLGRAVAEKGRKYGKYAHHTYTINSELGLHSRPSAAFIKEYVNVFLKSHPEKPIDIWFRTANKEVDGRGILGLMRLAAEKGQKVTILCKPKEVADEFYHGLESFYYNKNPLFLKVK